MRTDEANVHDPVGIIHLYNEPVFVAGDIEDNATVATMRRFVARATAIG
jgi:hypothetical protein